MRCYICNYCPETDTEIPLRGMKEIEEFKYVCSNCTSEINDALSDFRDEEETELERALLLEDEDL